MVLIRSRAAHDQRRTWLVSCLAGQMTETRCGTAYMYFTPVHTRHERGECFESLSEPQCSRFPAGLRGLQGLVATSDFHCQVDGLYSITVIQLKRECMVTDDDTESSDGLDRRSFVPCHD